MEIVTSATIQARYDRVVFLARPDLQSGAPMVQRLKREE